jgi:hypothetical protein
MLSALSKYVINRLIHGLFHIDRKEHDLGCDKGTEKGGIGGNLLIYVAKRTIWKQRNKIKYNNILCQTARLCSLLKRLFAMK